MTNNPNNIRHFESQKDKARNEEKTQETLSFKAWDEVAMYVLQLLGQHRFEAMQLLITKNFIQKWLQHFSFKSLILDLAMIHNKGEEYFYIHYELPVKSLTQ